MMLSSDSEDDLPSLSQRIGFSKTVGSSKEPINGEVTVALGRVISYMGLPLLVMECGVTNSEVLSVSNMTTSHRHLNPNNSASDAAIMVTAHDDDDVSVATEPKNGHTTTTNNCDIITITSSLLTTKDQQPQEVNRSVLIL